MAREKKKKKLSAKYNDLLALATLERATIKILRQEKEVWHKEIACRVPEQILATYNTVKRLQRKIDDIGKVNRQLSSGRKRKVIIEQKCSIISVKFCSSVERLLYHCDLATH